MTEQQILNRLGEPRYRTDENPATSFTIGYGDVFGQAYEIHFEHGRVVEVQAMR